MSKDEARHAGFDRWRQACAALISKPGESSRCTLRQYPIHSVTEIVKEKRDALHRNGEVFDNLEDLLRNYQETESEQKMHGMVDQWTDELVRTSPMIRFMSKHLSIVGCSPIANEGRKSNFPPILVAACPDGIAGGFSPSLPHSPVSESGIVICSNRIMDKSHLEKTLAHEMIHWWDHCRFNVQWDNLRHHACTEVSLQQLQLLQQCIGCAKSWLDPSLCSFGRLSMV